MISGVITNRLRTQGLAKRISCLILFILCNIFYPASMAAAQTKATLLVPTVEGLSQKIYNDIIDGIRSNPNLNIHVLEVSKKDTAAQIDEKLSSLNSEIIIALGNRSYKISQQLDNPVLKIAGGISGKPNGIPTVSLTASARKTLEELKARAPQVNELHLVYNQEYNGWWVKQVQEIAPQFDIQIITYETSNIKDGVKQYEAMLKNAPKKTSAIWLPLRSVVPAKTILPLLLRKAWDNKLVVIANNPAYTKLGGMLSLYPNHNLMGKQIAEFALTHHQGVDIEKIQGTETLKKSINTRTSSHLGLRLSNSDLDTFDRIYPVNK